jgi:hypothetical protein
MTRPPRAGPNRRELKRFGDPLFIGTTEPGIFTKTASPERPGERISALVVLHGVRHHSRPRALTSALLDTLASGHGTVIQTLGAVRVLVGGESVRASCVLANMSGEHRQFTSPAHPLVGSAATEPVRESSLPRGEQGSYTAAFQVPLRGGLHPALQWRPNSCPTRGSSPFRCWAETGHSEGAPTSKPWARTMSWIKAGGPYSWRSIVSPDSGSKMT